MKDRNEHDSLHAFGDSYEAHAVGNHWIPEDAELVKRIRDKADELASIMERIRGFQHELESCATGKLVLESDIEGLIDELSTAAHVELSKRSAYSNPVGLASGRPAGQVEYRTTNGL
jgi:hypothetical protein